MILRELLELCLSGVCVFSVAYWIASTALLHRRFRKRHDPSGGVATLDPVTFLRPLKTGLPDLGARLAEAAAVLGAGDQLVLGVDADSPESGVCTDFAERHPTFEIVVVLCRAGNARNPKINKLVQMQAAARCEHFIVMDSEAMPRADWVERFRCEWARTDAALLTAGYRFVGATRWVQRLDAAPVLLTLWPGLAVVEAAVGMRFALGACVAIRRETLEAVGGWGEFADQLAEDHALGQSVARVGGRVVLSQEVLSLQCDLLEVNDYWRHQLRAAVTYRVADPAGFAAQVVSHGITAAILLLPVSGGAPWAILLAGTVWVVRVLSVRASCRLLAWPFPHLWLFAPTAGLLESVVWIAAWCSPRVWWAGRWWKVNRSGALQPVGVDHRFEPRG